MTYKNILKGTLLALLVTGGGIAGALITKHYEPMPEIVTLDLDAIVKTVVLKTVKGTDSDKNKAKAVTAFATNLNGLIQTLAREKRLIILPSQAVIAGTRDITDPIRDGITDSIASAIGETPAP